MPVTWVSTFTAEQDKMFKAAVVEEMMKTSKLPREVVEILVNAAGAAYQKIADAHP